LQEIDADAPDVWKKYFVGKHCDIDAVRDEDRPALAAWTMKRQTLLQERLQLEVEAELEMDASLVRKSTPFLRVLVHSGEGTKLKDCALETAVLTIWEPAEEHFNLMKEGEFIELHGLGVHSGRYDGFKQLSSSGRSLIRRLDRPSFPEVVRSASGFEPRSIRTMVNTHAFARQLDSATQNAPVNTLRIFDTIGVTVSSIMALEGGGYALYLTDQSWLTLRVQFDQFPQGLTNHENQVIAMNDLQMQHFDTLGNCAVARYTSVSSTSKGPPELRYQLEQWKRQSPAELERISIYLDARMPLYQSCTAGTIIGAIVGLNPTLDGAMVSIQVESGTMIHNLSIPTSFLGMIREEVEKSPTVIHPSEELRLEPMKTLDFLFRAHGVLWRFDFIARSMGKTCSLVVRHVEKADLHTLARLHCLWSQ